MEFQTTPVAPAKFARGKATVPAFLHTIGSPTVDPADMTGDKARIRLRLLEGRHRNADGAGRDASEAHGEGAAAAGEGGGDDDPYGIENDDVESITSRGMERDAAAKRERLEHAAAAATTTTGLAKARAKQSVSSASAAATGSILAAGQSRATASAERTGGSLASSRPGSHQSTGHGSSSDFVQH